MTHFIPGQRWINNAQLQMGLGTVLKSDFRTVTVIFLATGETFVYAKESVPLTRVRFAPGDHIVTMDDTALVVMDVAENEGLLTYVGKGVDGRERTLEESLLNNYIQLNRPTERLFNGQIDRTQWFEVRYETRQHRMYLAMDNLRGLAGCRINLIPHQLYIANEVANRHAPRVLLADEVGLGKTIEAGMILHQKLVTERARRVLIIVPDSLVHQWLVEMLRRFNLRFSVFDAQRVEAIIAADDDEDVPQELSINPFHTEQLVLCSLDFLSSDPDYYRYCLDAGWDLMVVDEAHHLAWTEQAPGFEYQLIEKLAEVIPGVLLLTATPEQLGKIGHFARLRLLDPNRFVDYRSFIEEEVQYQPVAKALEQILAGQRLDTESLAQLDSILGGGDNHELIERLGQESPEQSEKQEVNARLVNLMLDRHGTGRVLFRNTRATVKGFPERVVYHYPAAMPEAYVSVLSAIDPSQLSESQLLLCPELLYQALNDDESLNWTNIDPRVGELAQLLKQLRSNKVLVIAASADTAIDLSETLRIRYGIEAAVFHEGMSLLERDRSAAWFADQVSGAKVMICSEIGSEGRNFQFSHHLVLFDLPLNPDLLEQRIGRLDRIGQIETINIHVLVLEHSAQQVMFDWYQQGLSAFEQTCPTGQEVFVHVRDDLMAALQRPQLEHADLIERSRNYNLAMKEMLQKGRDRLLELNSCRPEIAQQIRDRVLESDQQSVLQPYLEGLFDCLGVDYEIHSENCYVVNAGTHMLTHFPKLPEDGMTVTYDRETALRYEDVDYLTWDHPLVNSAMDLVVSGEMGNTAVVAAPIPGAARGAILLESIYVLESAATEQLQSDRYLPPTVIRIMIDQTGKRYDHVPSFRSMDQSVERVKREVAKRIVKVKENLLRKMVSASEKAAQKSVPDILQRARDQSREMLDVEISRLEALKKVNPNVRQDEIDFFRELLTALDVRIESASLRLDALRVIVAT